MLRHHVTKLEHVGHKQHIRVHEMAKNPDCEFVKSNWTDSGVQMSLHKISILPPSGVLERTLTIRSLGRYQDNGAHTFLFMAQGYRQINAC
jgi:hypothetical protein